MKALESARSAIHETNISPNEIELRREHYFTLYFKERKQYEKSFFANLNLTQQKKIHRFLLPLVRFSNHLQGYKHILLADDRTGSNIPKIYAVTHIGKMDLEILFEVIEEHFCWFTSGFEQVHKTFNEFILALNGVIYFNFEDKADRKLAFEKMIYALNNGDNIVIYPESAYNISPNNLVNPLNWGVIKAAHKTGAEIVPVGLEQFDKTIKICIGKFNVTNYAEDDCNVAVAAAELRDELCRLKWQILESEPLYSRNQISAADWQKHIKSQLKGTGDTIDDVERERYHPIGITSLQEAFAFMENLNPKKENAFLFRGWKNIL